MAIVMVEVFFYIMRDSYLLFFIKYEFQNTNFQFANDIINYGIAA